MKITQELFEFMPEEELALPSFECPCDDCGLFQGTETFTPQSPMILGHHLDGKHKTGGIMLVGQNPGQLEDWEGYSFVGASGQKLKEMLQVVGVPLNICFFTNVVKCATEKNTEPDQKHIKLCKQILLSEIAKVKPKIIVPLGNPAVKAVAGQAGITKLRGTVIISKINQRTIVPSYHPAHCLRYPQHLPALEADLRLVKNLYFDEKIDIKDQVEYYSYLSNDQHKSFVEYLRKGRDRITTVDIETKTLSPFHQFAKVLSIGFSNEEGTGWVVPLYHKDTPLPRAVLEGVLVTIIHWLGDANYKKVFHNGLFDILYIKKKLGIWPEYGDLVNEKRELAIGDNGRFVETKQPNRPAHWENKEVEVEGVFGDTMIAHYLAVSEEEMHGLKPLALQYTKMGNYDREIETLFAKIPKKLRDYEIHIPFEKLLWYNAADCDVTLQLDETFSKELKETETEKIYEYLVQQVVPTIVEDRSMGFTLDEEACKDLTADLEGEINKREAKLMEMKPVADAIALRAKKREELGKPNLTWTFGSTDALRVLFFDVLGYPSEKETKTKAPSLDEEVLQIYSSRGCEIAQALIDLREVKTHISKYGWKKVETWIEHDNLVHPQFLLSSTKTGRLSSRKPNFQNFPRAEEETAINPKNMIISRYGDDGAILEADYAQNEYRGLAHYSNEPNLIEPFMAGRDLHAEGAKMMYGYSDEAWLRLHEEETEKWKHLRWLFKRIIFGVLFGRGSEAVAKDLWIAAGRPGGGSQKFEREAEEKIDLFFEMNPYVRKWIEYIHRKVKKNLYIRSRFGRVRRLPQIWSMDKDVQAEAERQAVNFVPQSWSSDVCLIAKTRVTEFFKEVGWKASVIGPVHDSVVCDTHKDHLVEASCCLKYIMERPPRPLRVPLAADIAWGLPSWGKKQDVEITVHYQNWLERNKDYMPLLEELTKDNWGPPPSDEA